LYYFFYTEFDDETVLNELRQFSYNEEKPGMKMASKNLGVLGFFKNLTD